MGMQGRCHMRLKHQSYRTSSHSSTPIHNQMAGHRIRQALRTTFSRSSQHCRLPRLAPHTMRNVFLDLWSESSIVPRENVAEVLAAMVLPIIGWRNIAPSLEYAHTKRIIATLVQSPRKQSEGDRQQSIAWKLLQQLSPVTSNALRTKWQPWSNPWNVTVRSQRGPTNTSWTLPRSAQKNGQRLLSWKEGYLS